MRKALALFLSLLLLFAAVYVVGFNIVNSHKGDVRWEEETLYGDKEAVSGAVVSTRNTLDYHALWETKGALDGELNPVTDFTFSNSRIQLPQESVFTGLQIYVNDTFLVDIATGQDDGRIPAYAREKYAKLIADMRALYESCPIGEEKYFTVDLTQYMDYYTFYIHADYQDHDWGYVTEFENYFSGDMGDQLVQDFHAFFRIPLPENYTLEFSINRTANGVSFGCSATILGGPSEFFSVLTGETCYLTFNTVLEDGSVVDTSQIPGGFGIYRINMPRDAEGNTQFGSPLAANVFSLDPGEQVVDLSLSDDERFLYLYTLVKGREVQRTVIDIATMTQLQKYTVYEDSEDFFTNLITYDHFDVVIKQSINDEAPEENTIAVFSESENGLWTQEFTVPINLPGVGVDQEHNLFAVSDYSMDFDGETLVIAQNELVNRDTIKSWHFTDSSDFLVAAYDPSGLQYLGKYHVNLADINYVKDPMDSSIQPFYDIPVQVYWN